MTIFYLMFIAFIPFSTALIGAYGDQQISVVIYGINIFIVLVWAYTHWKYATKERRLVDIDLDPKFIATMSRRLIAGMIIYAAAITFSFLSTQASLVLFVLIPIYYLIPSKYYWLRSAKNK